MNLIAWHVALALIMLAFCLNEFLRGRLTALTQGVLSISIFAVIGAMFWRAGWKSGLAAIGASLVYGWTWMGLIRWRIGRARAKRMPY